MEETTSLVSLYFPASSSFRPYVTEYVSEAISLWRVEVFPICGLLGEI